MSSQPNTLVQVEASGVPKNLRRGGLECRNNIDLRLRRKDFAIFYLISGFLAHGVGLSPQAPSVRWFWDAHCWMGLAYMLCTREFERIFSRGVLVMRTQSLRVGMMSWKQLLSSIRMGRERNTYFIWRTVSPPSTLFLLTEQASLFTKVETCISYGSITCVTYPIYY